MAANPRRTTVAARVRKARLRRAGLDGPRLDVGRARLRLGPDPVILECGAHDGTDTLRILGRWPTARVYCFEPEPRAIAAWRANVTSPRAELFEVAVAAADGTAEFHRSAGRPPSDPDGATGSWDQSGSLRRPTGHLERWPWVTFPETMTVATRSLDSWTAEQGIGAVDLVWADVQGAEGDLLRGGRRTLGRTRFLYTETTDDPWYEGQTTFPDLVAQLPGWRIRARFPDDVLLENRRWRRFRRQP